MREVLVGAHTMRMELPDVVFFTFVGDVSAAEGPVLLGEWQRFAEERPWTLVLVDLRRSGKIAPEARRLSVRLPLKGRGTAAFGGGFAQRALATLLIKAYELLRPEADSPMIFVETEAEARAWLRERRRALERAQRADPIAPGREQH